MTAPFDGAKAAVFIGEQLLIYRRDNRPDIPWPDYWDFPGGGREGAETPEETLFREVHEEFGLCVGQGDVIWTQRYDAAHRPDAKVWFFVLALPASAEAEIVFGEEGQHWALMPLERVWALDPMVPSLRKRLADWVATGPSPLRNT
ncbi:NUDIX domain-containing protein [Loktanella sp. IMCC34160]|uniref:NUDIX domain-containing protein n=1 Tax=Loktanella sp. IMCC34160 TaxID=2510646 RepID=UPI00101E12CE|nr:NUDIX hydrolase [Loktanella sp. IMCC34160]RYG89526.1 NUDIX domain-containing protein [Loktanella sp. IMCC34160]